MFGFSACGGAEYKTTLQVTCIVKDGAAGKDGRLRVRKIYPTVVEGVVVNIIIIIYRLVMKYWKLMVTQLKVCHLLMLSLSVNKEETRLH